MTPTPTPRWTWALVAVTFVWGATFVVVQEAVERVPVYTFNAWRFLIAAALLAPFARRNAGELGRDGVLHACVLGVALWAGYAFQTFGLTSTTAPKAAFITGTVVVLTPLFQAALLRRAPAGQAVAGALLAFLGLALLTLEGSLRPASGDLLVFGCAIAFALHVVGLGAWSGQHPTAPLAVAQLAVAGALHMSAALVQGATSGVALLPRGAYVWTALLFTAALASAAAFVIQTAAQRVLSPTRVAVIFTMEPVFAWLTSWIGVPMLLAAGVVGLEAARFGVREAVGAVLILAGMLWSELRSSTRPDILAAPETAAVVD